MMIRPIMVERMIGSSLAARQVAKSHPESRIGSSFSSAIQSLHLCRREPSAAAAILPHRPG